MNIIPLFLLPNDIQDKIQSYLYFSDNVAINVQVINKIILNYTSYLLKEFSHIFYNRVYTLYFRIYKFLNQNQNKKIKEGIEKNMILILNGDESNYDILIHVEKILNNMNIVQCQKLYNQVNQ